MIPTSTQMGVDAHVPRSTTQALSFAIGYMLFGFRVAILLGHTEIDHMDNLMGSAEAERCCRREHLLLLPFVPVRPIKKLSGLMSR